MKRFKMAEEMLENEELMDALQEVTNAGELVAVFERFGIQLEEGLSPEKAYEHFLAGKNRGSELSEDELENVSGGFWGWVAVGVLIIIVGQVVEEFGYQQAKKVTCRR